MGLKFSYLEGSKMANEPFIAKQRLYVNADESEIVPEDSPAAAFLLAGEGCEVPEAAVERYGLRPKLRAKIAPEEAPTEEPLPAEPEEPPKPKRRRRARKG
ncbi:hypothetical protein LCGC14_1349600 [marine sediment metagenome]|uniref:Uncharacterized protein n=1 Tax=marine sediment metagenome TaxID=412755 RepID=A0A0F9KBZ8_9ZZZZ